MDNHQTEARSLCAKSWAGNVGKYRDGEADSESRFDCMHQLLMQAELAKTGVRDQSLKSAVSREHCDQSRPLA